MNITTLRLRYTQFLLIGLLGLSVYIMTQSLSSRISEIEDNLWGREFLVNSFTRLRLKLGDRVFPQVLVGKDGWLEFSAEKNLDGYQNVIKIPPGALEKSQQKLEQLYEALHKRNITLILVVPPNKVTIYPDKLPDGIQKLNPQSKLDMFTAYIEQHGPPVLVDLRPALLEGRKNRLVYYQTDTHWNAYGAFIAYREVMKELSKTYPELTPKSIKDFKKRSSQPFLTGLARTMGATHLLEPYIDLVTKNNNGSQVTSLILNDDTIPLEVSTTPNNKLPTLLMFRDSFGRGMQHFIAPHFSKSTFILTRSQYPDALSLKTIDAFKPDIVIVEVLERLFDNQVLDTLLQQLLSE